MNDAELAFLILFLLILYLTPVFILLLRYGDSLPERYRKHIPKSWRKFWRHHNDWELGPHHYAKGSREGADSEVYAEVTKARNAAGEELHPHTQQGISIEAGAVRARKSEIGGAMPHQRSTLANSHYDGWFAVLEKGRTGFEKEEEAAKPILSRVSGKLAEGLRVISSGAGVGIAGLENANKEVQGPFDTLRMQKWFYARKISGETLVRPPSEWIEKIPWLQERQASGEFFPIKQLFPDPQFVFVEPRDLHVARGLEAEMAGEGEGVLDDGMGLGGKGAGKGGSSADDWQFGGAEGADWANADWGEWGEGNDNGGYPEAQNRAGSGGGGEWGVDQQGQGGYDQGGIAGGGGGKGQPDKSFKSGVEAALEAVKLELEQEAAGVVPSQSPSQVGAAAAHNGLQGGGKGGAAAGGGNDWGAGKGNGAWTDNWGQQQDQEWAEADW